MNERFILTKTLSGSFVIFDNEIKKDNQILKTTLKTESWKGNDLVIESKAKANEVLSALRLLDFMGIKV